MEACPPPGLVKSMVSKGVSAPPPGLYEIGMFRFLTPIFQTLNAILFSYKNISFSTLSYVFFNVTFPLYSTYIVRMKYVHCTHAN